MIRYWTKHAPTDLRRMNVERLARIHNGGPRGAQNPRTVPYWNKVREAMKR